MRKKIILIYLSITVFVLILGGYFFLYNIYGSEVKRSAQNLYADTSSEITIASSVLNPFQIAIDVSKLHPNDNTPSFKNLDSAIISPFLNLEFSGGSTFGAVSIFLFSSAIKIVEVEK
jgi:hypothetical protein